ncbi:hypothetical protein IT895_12515 [Halomonas sp. A40-4]|uniref:hypothetical protein n=1 Tax=Halomonas sp. A40-4 TaxID=2785909 RepID=UPI0018EFB4F4|nr:hypothetical protein [Halomonas sp. A40-4]QPL45016.1 hypothetical protein IT895_12515 [Halomonas sp. A40-4]
MRRLLSAIGYSLIIFSVLSVGIVALYLYEREFGANGFSENTGDWANFATFISGTIGVAAVVATLAAFMITIKQQQALIRQQKIQIEQADGHQQRLNAYQRASSLLPDAFSALRHHLDKSLGEIASDESFAAYDMIFINRRYRVCDFYMSDDVLQELMSEDLKVQNFIGHIVTKEVYRFARFVTGILQDAPDLYDVIMLQLVSHMDVLRCAMAYRRSRSLQEEWYLISQFLRLPKNYEGLSQPEQAWQLLGHEKNDEDKS